MKQYDSYKDSGVEWIGKIPSHWEVCAFKRKIVINNGRDYKEYLDDEIYPVMGSGGCFTYCSKYLYDGEAVLLGRKGTIDKPLYINGKFWAVDTMFYATPLSGLHCKYAYYLALTFPFDYYSTSTALPSMTQSDLGNNLVALPPLDEQKSIAGYLDEKCGKIDKAIATQEKRLELLKELRQNIITQAVTRGINPNAPLKDSGVEWIGKVPEHWKVCRIKNVLKQGADSIKIGPFGSSLTGKVGADLEYKVYGQWNIVGADFNAGTNTVNKETFDELSKSYKVISGDILVSMMGTIGKCAVIPEGIQEGIMDSHVVKIRLNDSIMIGSYFEYIYDKDKSNVIFNQLQKMKGGSIMDGLNSTIIKSLTILVPPLSEQQEIVSYIESQTARLDKSIEKAEHQIELLQELKQSIITEVVTGKRKVD